MNTLEYEMEFDTETLAKLRTLERARTKAELHEDYSEAKRINQAIVELKKVGQQLLLLTERKILAVRNKDYTSADILKREIEALKRALYSDNPKRAPD